MYLGNAVLYCGPALLSPKQAVTFSSVVSESLFSPARSVSDNAVFGGCFHTAVVSTDLTDNMFIHEPQSWKADEGAGSA